MTEQSDSSKPPPPPPRHDRRTFVIAMIAIAALLFIANEALLYYRWVTMSEPSCVLIIDAAPALSGAEITVDGVELAQALHATIGVNDRYSIPFYLDPGRYTVKVKIGDELQTEPVTVELTRQVPGQMIDLRRVRPTTVPTTTPSQWHDGMVR